MNKKLVLLIAILVVSIGFLSGCNETSVANNDDEEFIRQANTIVDYFYPVSCYSLASYSSKTMSYRLKLNEYELSFDCNSIRKAIFYAFDCIEDGYNYYLTYYTLGCDASLVKYSVEYANTYLESARIRLLAYG